MKKLPILICFGTRSEWLKIKSILNRMHPTEYEILFTGQHLDLIEDVTFNYKINIKQFDNRLDSIVMACLEQFPNEEFEGVMIVGGTASAFGCALAAFHRHIPIYYLESGLRSNNLQHPYPEEGYRQMISRIANYNFTPTSSSGSNLFDERVLGDIFVVGNTILDTLPKITDPEYGNIVLITMHRRENLSIIDKWFSVINELAKENYLLKFILPIHLNPQIKPHIHLLNSVEVMPQVPHSELLDYINRSRFVITDSGGIQEEATFLHKKTIVCRKTTERPEARYTGHLHLCEHPDKLKEVFDYVNNHPYIIKPCPYGDGKSSKRIYEIIKNL